jgi:hypothetical protein
LEPAPKLQPSVDQTVAKVAIEELLVTALKAYLTVLRSITISSTWQDVPRVTAWDILGGRLQLRLRNVAPVPTDAEHDRARAEDRLALAEAKWKRSFRHRAAAMNAAMKIAPNEDPPTPPTDGDD